MKIAFLAPELIPAWGGVGTYSVELIRKLCEYDDLEIHIITPKRGRNYDKKAVEKIFGNKVKIHNMSYAKDNFFYNFKFQLQLLLRFRKLNKIHKFDIIHAANLVNMPDIFLKIFLKQDIPSVTTIHTTLESQSKNHSKENMPGIQASQMKKHDNRSRIEYMTRIFSPLIGILERIYLKNTKYFIAVSRWVSGFINETEEKETRIINNGIDTERFSPEKRRHKDYADHYDNNGYDGMIDRFAELKNIKDKPIILYSGRLMALKGLPTLIEAAGTVLKDIDIHLVIAGTGERERWIKLMNDAKIPERSYSFLGYVPYESMHELYAIADIFVLPSFTESFPLTILEAMSSQKAVIASDVGGIPEIIENGKDGLLIRPGDAKELSRAIVSLIKDKKRSNKIANAARKKVMNRFSSKIMAEQTRKYYYDILKKEGRL